jgi:hypothetical protein
MNEARPKLTGPNGLFAAALMVLFFTAVGGTPFLLLVDYFYLDSPHAPIPLLICALIPGFLFGIWYARNLRNRQNWVLTDAELIGGVSSQKVFPLASIEKVIVGLPTASAIPALDKILEDDEPGTSTNTFLSILSFFAPNLNTARRNYKLRTFQRERTFLLIFNDGSLLPLYLLSASNGDSLEAELERRLKDRLVFNFDYSAEQAHKLSMVEANVLISADKSPHFAFSSEPK